MSQEELIAETNALLKKFMELREEDRAASAKVVKESEEKLAVLHEKRDSPEDMQKRFADIQSRNEERAKNLMEREVKFRDELTLEMQKQTELLTKILEKLSV